MNVTKPDYEVCNRLVRRNLECNDRRPENVECRYERRGLKRQRAHVVFTLVVRLVSAITERTPFACAAPECLSRADMASRESRLFCPQPVVRQEEAMCNDPCWGP